MGDATSSRAPAVGRETRVFGVVILEQKRVLERIAGSECLARALARLPDERRREFEHLSMFTWCRSSTVGMVYGEIAELLHRDVEALTAEVVRHGFGTVLRTVWRMLARFSSDESLVARAGTLYARTVDRGNVRAFVEVPGHLVMEITDRPEISQVDIAAIGAGIATALEVAGRRAKVSHRRLVDGVRYDVRVAPTSLPPDRLLR